MEITTRLLALVAELVFVPTQIEDKKARIIFDKISDTHNITSFNLIPGEGIIMGTKKEREVINYKLMKDRLILIYEFCDKSLNYYIELVNDMLKTFTNTTNSSLFIMHNIILRKLLNIPGINDTREFIIKKMYSLDEEALKPFQRPLHMIGSRIFFPAKNEQEIESYDVKIETSMDDSRTFFIENKGIFPKPFDFTKETNIVVEDIIKTEEFLSNNVINFLMQFTEEN